MTERESRKFDPAKASLLDSSERDAYLPDAAVVDLLELSGDETVLDYGAGTGRVSLEAARRAPAGRVIALDESFEMLELLRARIADTNNVDVVGIKDNVVPLDAAGADRILAINLLHEVRGESALAEMLRLLTPGGMLLVIDWDRERPSEPGPPLRLRYSRSEAIGELIAAGLAVESVEAKFPFHFVLRAHREDPR